MTLNYNITALTLVIFQNIKDQSLSISGYLSVVSYVCKYICISLWQSIISMKRPSWSLS